MGEGDIKKGQKNSDVFYGRPIGVKLFVMLVFYEIVFAHQNLRLIDNRTRNKEEQIFEPLTLI